MNERIAELAKQCWDERPQGQLHFDNVKFAEMIVRECADLFEVEYGQSEVSGNEVAEVVKKHFGVEQ